MKDKISCGIAGDLTIASIEFLRKTHSIRDVILHEMPLWFMRRVCAVNGGYGRVRAESEMYRLCEGAQLWDHWGKSMTYGGQSAMVSEPYADMDKAIEWAEAIATTLGILVTVYPESSMKSWWFPGETMRIEFYECIDAPMPLGVQTLEQLRIEHRR